MQDKLISIFKIVISVAAFTAILFPMVKWISYHVGALDYPNERKVHKKPMPLLGGLMMFFGFLFLYIERIISNHKPYLVNFLLMRNLDIKLIQL